MGFTEYAIDEYTPASNASPTNYYNGYYGHKIYHSLGETPKIAAVVCPKIMRIESNYDSSDSYLGLQILFQSNTSITSWEYYYHSQIASSLNSGVLSAGSGSVHGQKSMITTDSFVIFGGASSANPKLIAGEKYYIITATF